MATKPKVIYAMRDASIWESEPDTNHGTGVWSVGFVTAKERRGVLYFDLSSLPAEAKIQAADLTIAKYLLQPGISNVTIDAYDLNEQPFQEYNVTWNHRTPSKLWTTAGALDSGQTKVSTATLHPADTIVKLDLTSVVYDWHKHRTTNCGLIIATPTSTEVVSFWNKSAVTLNYRPHLNILYYQPETLSVSKREKWAVQVYDRADNLIYDDYLPFAPEEIAIQQTLPTENMLLVNRRSTVISPWKGGDGSAYIAPFDDNTVDQFMLERSFIAREIVFTWNVKSQELANLWQMWAEFGCHVILYPGQRYDPVKVKGQALLGVDGENVWTAWPFQDATADYRLWKNGVEVTNASYVNGWVCDDEGSRLANGTMHSPEDVFTFLGRYVFSFYPVEVIPAYSAAYPDRTLRKSVAALQVIGVEADYHDIG